ncbi:MAG: hypothetical protein ACREMN_05955 [Gemmatimonadales bacterium]
MTTRPLTTCFRDAIHMATPSIARLARDAQYAAPTFEMYLYQRRPSPDAARALARALDRRATILARYAKELREIAGEPPRGPRRRAR